MAEALAPHRSPLEQFVRDYLDLMGGAWDEIEPQVYDVIDVESEPPSIAENAGVTRITFDSEALAEHSQAQLASFGTPLIDRWLQQMLRQKRQLHLYRLGLNLAPHDLAGRLRRALVLPEGAKPEVAACRLLDFPQALYWFLATFTSDQKEEEIVPAAVDLHYLRLARHYDKLLERECLAEHPGQRLPEPPRASVAAGLAPAQESVLRTILGLANARSRELRQRVAKQAERMQAYYDDLKAELAASRQRQLDAQELQRRIAAIEREARHRIDELYAKSRMAVRVRLLHVAVIHQPKLALRVQVRLSSGSPEPLRLVWDPLLETVEAAPCGSCRRPTLAWELASRDVLVCPECARSRPAPTLRKSPPMPPPKRPR